MKDRRASQFQGACGWAFDLGRFEEQRAREMMLVEMDGWLEKGKILADVSDEALEKECHRRGPYRVWSDEALRQEYQRRFGRGAVAENLLRAVSDLVSRRGSNVKPVAYVSPRDFAALNDALTTEAGAVEAPGWRELRLATMVGMMPINASHYVQDDNGYVVDGGTPGFDWRPLNAALARQDMQDLAGIDSVTAGTAPGTTDGTETDPGGGNDQ